MANALERYCSTGNRSVEGWLVPGAIAALCGLARAQRGLGIKGPVCEIGVHHGRLFILLHLLSASDERSLAIDLFEAQDENVDKSGKGSREHLMANLRTHRCDLGRIELLAENSLRLTATRIVELCRGRPRLFSIDGGHTAEATQNDMALANDAVCDGGLVILDDYFNSAWPAVSEGACAFMRQADARLLPVAITANKLIFTQGEHAAETYRDSFLRTWPGSTTSTVFGRKVVCFAPAPPATLRRRVTASQGWIKIRQTPVGLALQKLKRWV
jgi:hypothetical protein